MIFGMTPMLALHVFVSLVGIATGLVVLFGLIGGRRLEGWTAMFLATTIATSVTGFLLPFDRLLPSHVFGLISLALLAVAVLARYPLRLAGAWRWIYVVTAVTSLYLNVFVLVVQIFQKLPAANALAPTQSEPPFLVAQLAVLALFVALGALATVRFRTGRVHFA